MVWNFNLFLCPRYREANIMLIVHTVKLYQHQLPIVPLPPSFINKGEPQQTGNNHWALMRGISSAVARRRYQVIIDGV